MPKKSLGAVEIASTDVRTDVLTDDFTVIPAITAVVAMVVTSGVVVGKVGPAVVAFGQVRLMYTLLDLQILVVFVDVLFIVEDVLIVFKVAFTKKVLFSGRVDF